MKDYRNYNLYVNRIKVLKVALIYFVLLFSILFFGNIVDISDTNSKIATCIAISLGVSVIFILVYFISIIFKSKKVFRADDLLRHVQKYTIDNTGIFSKSEMGDAKLTWSEVVKVEKSRNGIYIFISRNEAIIIPYRIFKNKSEIERLNAIVESNTGK